MAKNKHEVSTARFRLNATLQDLVEKKDDGLSDDDDSQPDTTRTLSSPLSSPSKKIIAKTGGRKRKRKDDLDAEGDHYHHTYVMKLFDRSVDLAQFEENTPLYPICRAWMLNSPHTKTPAVCPDSPPPNPPSDDEFGYVYKLPDPVFIKGESGEEYKDLRIPSPLPQTDPPLDINADPEKAPPPEDLLLNHINRWKHTRQRWRDASLRNECRFAPSMNLLRDMIEQQMKEG